MRKHVLRRLLRFLMPYGWKLILALVLMVCGNLLSLTAPLLSG